MRRIEHQPARQQENKENLEMTNINYSAIQNEIDAVDAEINRCNCENCSCSASGTCACNSLGGCSCNPCFCGASCQIGECSCASGAGCTCSTVSGGCECEVCACGVACIDTEASCICGCGLEFCTCAGMATADA